MPYHDAHLHSDHSFDGEAAVLDYADAAAAMGLAGITVTDHLDLGAPGLGDVAFDGPGCLRDVMRARAAHPGIRVLYGVEAGLTAEDLGRTEAAVSGGGYDYVVASVHYIRGGDLYYPDYYDGRTKAEATEGYLAATIECLGAFNDYDCLGHLGYLSRYWPYPDKAFGDGDGDLAGMVDAVLRALAEGGKGLEVNTAGIAVGGKASPLPGYGIVARFLELGGENVTLGSDAHRAGDLGRGFGPAAEALRGLGLRYLAYYENRKPVHYRV